MPDNPPVDLDPANVKPVEPGQPVKLPALSQTGATFAERAAARQLAVDTRAVDDDETENKGISSAPSKAAHTPRRRKA